MKGQAHDVRWILAKNTGATEVPAFGVVEIDGVTHTESNQMVLNVKRPTSDEPALFGINGWQAIPLNSHGLITFDGPVYVAYDTAEAPAIGEGWGPQIDSYLAKQDTFGLIVFGTTTIGEAKTQKIAVMDFVRGSEGPKRFCRFTLDGALSGATASATITDQYGPGSDHDVGVTITVHNLYDPIELAYSFAADSGKAGYATWNSGVNWIIVQLNCP